MTTCVNPINTMPGTQPCVNFGAYPGMMPGNVFGTTPQTQTFPGFINNQVPTGFSNPTWPSAQWPVNSVPFYGQQFYPGFPGYTNNQVPTPAFNTTPWSGGFAFNPAQWTNTNPFINTPWTNGYGGTPFCGFTPNIVPTWNNGYVTPTNAFNPSNTYANPFVNPVFNTPWNTTPFAGFPTPQTTPFGFAPNTGWQTPWNGNFNTSPYGGYGTTPFVGNYAAAPFTPGFVNPITSGWTNLAATINALSQPTNWSPAGTTPFASPNTNLFNTTPWMNGFPTFGGFNPTTPLPFGGTPLFNGINATPWLNCAPSNGFNPLATSGLNTPFGHPPFPTNFTNTPWSNTPPVFGGYNPAMFSPAFPAVFTNQAAPGFNPAYTNGYTPTATPTPGVPATRANAQNGDGSYRNGV